MAEQAPIVVEKVDDPALLNYLDYIADRAEIIVSGSALQFMPFEVEDFEEDEEYWHWVDTFRSRGYASAEPIAVWPGDNGRWIIDENDSARFMAAMRVADDFFANLLSTKIPKVRCVLHAQSRDGRYSAPQADFGYG